MSSSFTPLPGLDQRYLGTDSPTATGVLSADALSINAASSGAIQTTDQGTLASIGAPTFLGNPGDCWFDAISNRYRCTGVGWMGVGSTSAPTVTTDAPDTITPTTVNLNGSVNPNNQATTYQFQYGVDTTYGTNLPSTAASAGSDVVPTAYTRAVTGLTANSVYHYRLVATNATGTTTGPDQTFTTTTVGAPIVVTGAASSVGQTAATIAGSVNPNGSATQYQFQYGPSTAYGQATPSTSAGSGSTAVPETVNLTGLTPGSIYHYAIVATNAGGTTIGNDATFTTAATSSRPTVTPGAAFGITQTGATVYQNVNPNGAATSVVVQYGSTTAYGTSAAAQNIGAGNGLIQVQTVASGLTANTVYHWRCVATNANGAPVNGPDQTFTTSPSTGPVNTVAASISGTPAVGSTLTALHGTWTGTAPITYTYAWTRDGATIAGQTGTTYTTVTADGGHSVGCIVTATDGNGVSNSVQPTVSVTAGGTPPTPVSPPVIS